MACLKHDGMTESYGAKSLANAVRGGECQAMIAVDLAAVVYVQLHQPVKHRQTDISRVDTMSNTADSLLHGLQVIFWLSFATRFYLFFIDFYSTSAQHEKQSTLLAIIDMSVCRSHFIALFFGAHHMNLNEDRPILSAKM